MHEALWPLQKIRNGRCRHTHIIDRVEHVFIGEPAERITQADDGKRH
jgi:hypothetical protein